MSSYSVIRTLGQQFPSRPQMWTTVHISKRKNPGQGAALLETSQMYVNRTSCNIWHPLWWSL